MVKIVKEEEMPDKVYLLDYNDAMVTPLEGDTVYVREDAFIEKACDAYCKVCGHYPHTVPTHICRNNCDYFSDFKKYMKGE